MRKRTARRVMVPAGGMTRGDMSNPTDVPRRDPNLEKTVRRANFSSWYPFYDFAEYFGTVDGLTPGQQMLADLANNGNAIPYFDDVPPNLTLGNIRQAGQFPFPFDLYGAGLIVKGDEVFNMADDIAVDPFVGQDFRQIVAEHTRLEIKVRDATILINHWSGLIPPGVGVSGGVATTSNNVDRMQSVQGVPHPMAFFRFGGPDRGEVVQCNKSDLIEVNLYFDNIIMAALTQWFPGEGEQTPKLALSVGVGLFGWTHRKVF